MNIAELLGLDKVEDMTGEWNGTAFNFTAKTQLLDTPIVRQNLAEGLGPRPMGLAEGLNILIDSWDIHLNGEAFPPDTENLAKCPRDFLLYVLGLIVPAQAQAANG